MGKIYYHVLKNLPEGVDFDLIYRNRTAKVSRKGNFITFKDDCMNSLRVEISNLEDESEGLEGVYDLGMFRLNLYRLRFKFTKDTAEYAPRLLNTMDTSYHIECEPNLSKETWFEIGESEIIGYHYNGGKLYAVLKERDNVEIPLPFVAVYSE